MKNLKILNLIKCDSYDDLSKYAYEVVKQKILANPNITLGLPTGRTPLKMYEYLRCDKSIDFKNVKTYNLDEYLDINLDSKESYHTYMKTNLFEGINIDQNNCFIPSIDSIYSYDDLTLNNIDLMILGVGENGHIGFNEPYTPKDSLTHIVRLDDRTIKQNKDFFDCEMPKYAITMGLKNIMSSKSIILLVSGNSKKEVFDKFMKTKTYDKSLPVSILHEHNDVTIIYDI